MKCEFFRYYFIIVVQQCCHIELTLQAHHKWNLFSLNSNRGLTETLPKHAEKRQKLLRLSGTPNEICFSLTVLCFSKCCKSNTDDLYWTNFTNLIGISSWKSSFRTGLELVTSWLREQECFDWKEINFQGGFSRFQSKIAKAEHEFHKVETVRDANNSKV
jgi:hypothetical protein